MSSYYRILYHLVFRTKNGDKTLEADHRAELLAYFFGVLKNKDCFVYAINGMEDHMHILIELNPTIALADLMRDIKTSTSLWIKQSGKFPLFYGWAVGYGAFTYAWRDKNMIVNYIKNQQKHHRKKSYNGELRKYLTDQGIEFIENYFP